MRYSNGTDIPEELFEHILWHACGGRLLPDRPGKHHVAAFASVCRYWARLARRQLFQNITLRTQDDALRFCGMLDTPPLHDFDLLSKICAHLQAEPDNTHEPWLHHCFFSIVPKMQVPKLQKHQEFSLQVRVSGGRMQRSLHPSLPRSIPSSLMPLPRLHLEGVRFPSCRVLSRLLLSIPVLRSFAAYKITFDKTPSYEDLLTPPLGREMCDIGSDDLQLCLSLIPLLLANTTTSTRTGRRAPQGVLSADDVKTLWELLYPFASASSFYLSSGISNSLYLTYHSASPSFAAPEMGPGVEVRLSPWPLSLNTPPQMTAAPTAPPALHVETIVLVLYDTTELADTAPSLCTEDLWTRFASAALGFPRLKCVELQRAQDPGEESGRGLAFVGITDAAFAPLVEAGKFACVVEDEYGGSERRTDGVEPKNALSEGAVGGGSGGGGHV